MNTINNISTYANQLKQHKLSCQKRKQVVHYTMDILIWIEVAVWMEIKIHSYIELQNQYIINKAKKI